MFQINAYDIDPKCSVKSLGLVISQVLVADVVGLADIFVETNDFGNPQGPWHLCSEGPQKFSGRFVSHCAI